MQELTVIDNSKKNDLQNDENKILDVGTIKNDICWYEGAIFSIFLESKIKNIKIYLD